KPAMALYGIDPATSGFRYLEVDNKGIASGGKGVIVGDRATLRTPCVNRAPRPGQGDATGGFDAPGNGGTQGPGSGTEGPGADAPPGSASDGRTPAATQQSPGRTSAGPSDAAFLSRDTANLASSLSCQRVTFIDARP